MSIDKKKASQQTKVNLQQALDFIEMMSKDESLRASALPDKEASTIQDVMMAARRVGYQFDESALFSAFRIDWGFRRICKQR